MDGEPDRPSVIALAGECRQSAAGGDGRSVSRPYRRGTRSCPCRARRVAGPYCRVGTRSTRACPGSTGSARARESGGSRRRRRGAAGARAASTHHSTTLPCSEPPSNCAAAEVETALAATRARAGVVDEELDRLTDSVHRDEIARAEQRLRVEQLELRSVEEYGVDPEILLDDYGTGMAVAVWTESSTRRRRAPTPSRSRTSATSRRNDCGRRRGRSHCLAG